MSSYLYRSTYTALYYVWPFAYIQLICSSLLRPELYILWELSGFVIAQAHHLLIEGDYGTWFLLIYMQQFQPEVLSLRCTLWHIKLIHNIFGDWKAFSYVKCCYLFSLGRPKAPWHLSPRFNHSHFPGSKIWAVSCWSHVECCTSKKHNERKRATSTPRCHCVLDACDTGTQSSYCIVFFLFFSMLKWFSFG